MITIEGDKEFIRRLDGKRVKSVIDSQTETEIRKQLLFLRREVIDYIREKRHGVANSPMTALIKGSDHPLADRGDLIASIATAFTRTNQLIEAGVGVNRRVRTKTGQPMVNIAAALHDGYTLTVTPRTRAAIFAKARKRNRGRFGRSKLAKINALSGGTSTYVIKGRPFIKEPLAAREPAIIAALGDSVQIAINKL